MSDLTSYTFTAVLEADLEAGGFAVSVPALPGCITQGETVGECVANAQEAIGLYLDDLARAGEPIPEEQVPPRLRSVTVRR